MANHEGEMSVSYEEWRTSWLKGDETFHREWHRNYSSAEFDYIAIVKLVSPYEMEDIWIEKRTTTTYESEVVRIDYGT